MQAISVTVLGFLGVSLSPCLEEFCPLPQTPPQIWLMRSPFMISIAPHSRDSVDSKGSVDSASSTMKPQKTAGILPTLTRRNETLTLIFPAGAGMDPTGGGFHARVAARAAVRMLTPSWPGLPPVTVAPSIGGSCISLHIHYPDPWRPTVLQIIRTLLEEGPDERDFENALAEEITRAGNSLCPCMTGCCCDPLQQAMYQGIEIFDPLPGSATRRGNLLHLRKVTIKSSSQWFDQHLHQAWIHLDLPLKDLHSRNRFQILSDIQRGLGPPRPTAHLSYRPRLHPFTEACWPSSQKESRTQTDTLLEISAFRKETPMARSVPTEERVALLKISVPKGREERTRLKYLNSKRWKSSQVRTQGFCHDPYKISHNFFSRFSRFLNENTDWSFSQTKERWVIQKVGGLLFGTWQ